MFWNLNERGAYCLGVFFLMIKKLSMFILQKGQQFESHWDHIMYTDLYTGSDSKNSYSSSSHPQTVVSKFEVAQKRGKPVTKQRLLALKFDSTLQEFESLSS